MFFILFTAIILLLNNYIKSKKDIFKSNQKTKVDSLIIKEERKRKSLFQQIDSLQIEKLLLEAEIKNSNSFLQLIQKEKETNYKNFQNEKNNFNPNYRIRFRDSVKRTNGLYYNFKLQRI